MWSRNCVNRNLRSKNRYTFITVVALGCFIFLILLGYMAFGQEDGRTTLKQVHIIFRHGERSPNWFYVQDPYKNHSHWSVGLGELTNNGKHLMYEFGKVLRGRYKHFLPEMYQPKDVLVQSSYADRCQMSALTLLAGLYPPKGDQIWNPDLLWQPIPINSRPRQNDNMIAAKASCPSFTKEKKIVDDDLNNNIKEEFKDLFPYLSKNTGNQISNISQVETLYSLLQIEHENKLQLPKWTETVFPEPLRKIAKLSLDSFTYTDKLKRLQAGPLLGEIVDHLKRQESGEKVKKLYLYSGHDLTVNNLLRALGFKFEDLPDFGSALAVELHYSHLEHTVSLVHLKSSLSSPSAITVHDCGEPCLLDRFSRLVSHLIPLNWNEECKEE